jgi:hypothetical protein
MDKHPELEQANHNHPRLTVLTKPTWRWSAGGRMGNGSSNEPKNKETRSLWGEKACCRGWRWRVGAEDGPVADRQRDAALH